MTGIDSLPDLGAGPQLLMGWRKGNRLHGGYVPVHEDVAPELRGICDRATTAISSREQRTYEPDAHLEKNEQYFLLSIGDLPEPSSRRRSHPQLASDGQLPSELAAVADLIALIRAPHLPQISATQLREGSFHFYAMVWSVDGAEGIVAFVKKADPVLTLESGRVFFQFGDTLKRVDRPDLALYDDIDVVVTPERVFALNQTAFERLFTDVKVVLQDVPERVADISKALQSVAPMTAAATAALLQRSRTRVSYASRLRRLVPRLSTLSITPDKVRDAIERHGDDPSRVLNDNNQFEFGEAEVGMFLDILEGRWFEDDLSGERRRADRYSKRS